MQTLVTVIHICTCFLLVLVVLLQAGKGAEISTSLGGSSQTIFGSSGGANFFTRFTSAAAGIFMLTSMTLTLMSGQSKKSLFELEPPQSRPSAQVTPSAAAPPPAPVASATSAPEETAAPAN